ncbi:MAG: hypothetical protein KKH06_04560, partial [Gammaproteobacteria bacterium]|nr:hypothetical protein [Gammaproteobacteria bacterium]
QGKFPLLEKPFSVRQLVENLQFLEEPAAQAKGLNLTMDYPHALPDILIGDEFRMYRILINLVSNAIKFTEKGSVELRVREIKKDLNKKEILLRFIVKDTGIGIPQDKQEIIFEMFSKLTPSNTGRYQGFGLGLKLVKEFVKDLGGTIKVESAPSKGAIFICTIPFRLPDERVQSLEKNHEG